MTISLTFNDQFKILLQAINNDDFKEKLKEFPFEKINQKQLLPLIIIIFRTIIKINKEKIVDLFSIIDAKNILKFKLVNLLFSLPDITKEELIAIADNEKIIPDYLEFFKITYDMNLLDRMIFINDRYQNIFNSYRKYSLKYNNYPKWIILQKNIKKETELEVILTNIVKDLGEKVKLLINQKDNPIENILGPVNNIVDDKDESICSKLGGCYMLSCNDYPINHEDICIDQENYNEIMEDAFWFNYKCDTCKKEIKKKYFAVRFPLNRGWRGCYCSFKCLLLKEFSFEDEYYEEDEETLFDILIENNKKGKINSEVLDKIINLKENLIQNGIIDRIEE